MALTLEEFRQKSATEYPTQSHWAAAVNRACELTFGAGIFELVGDWPEADLYESGSTINDALDWISEEIGWL